MAWSRSTIHFHENLCPSLYENCIKYLAKLWYLLFHIWWYSITCRLCKYTKRWSCDTVKYLQRSQEWISLLRWSIEHESAQQAVVREVPGVVERESAQQAAAREEPAVWEPESRQCVAAGRREEENYQRRNRCKTLGVVECKSAQQAVARDVPGVVERESAQQAAAREEPAVRERKSRQRAERRLKKTFKMACKYVNGQYIFHQPCGLWNAPCVHGCGYIHLLSSTPGSRKKCCSNGCLSSASDNLMRNWWWIMTLTNCPNFWDRLSPRVRNFWRSLPQTTI